MAPPLKKSWFGRRTADLWRSEVGGALDFMLLYYQNEL
jgi:hypothetical protein